MRCSRCGRDSRGHRALATEPDPLEGDPTPDEICATALRQVRRNPLPAPESTRAVNRELAQYGLKVVRGQVVILVPTDAGKPIPATVTDRNLRRNWGQPVGLFSGVSKMPGKAFSIPAGSWKEGGRCHVADFEVENSICEGCYALQGQYIQGSAQRAQWQRLMWVERAAFKHGPEGAGRALAIAIRWLARDPQRKAGGSRRRRDIIEAAQFFRLHDSGAVYSPAYAQTWLAVACYLYASAPPVINIWVPVRNWALALREAKKQGGGLLLARRHRILAPLIRMNRLPNVTVRPSALSWGKTIAGDEDPFGVGGLAPVFPGLSAGTGTWIKGGEPPPPGFELCSAPAQAGRCFGDLPDAKPRPPWRRVGEKEGYEIYEKVRSRARRGSPKGKVETKLRWMGGGHRCTACWNPTTIVLYGEHGEGVAAGLPGLSPKTISRMAQVRRIVQAYGNPKDVRIPSDVRRTQDPAIYKIGEGRRNSAGWMVLDPRTSAVFARLYPAKEAQRLAERAGLLVVHDGTGQVFDPRTKACVGVVVSA